MRAPLLFSGILLGLSTSPALAQAVSGGQAPQAGGTDIRANPYNSMNAGDQYSQRKQIDGLQHGATVDGKPGTARPAMSNELTAGAAVNDKAGVPIAKIEQIDPDGVVITTGAAKVKIPADAFGHNEAGLLLDMTKAQFEQIVAKANAGS